MNILYNDKVDLLYIRLDERKQEVVKTSEYLRILCWI